MVNVPEIEDLDVRIVEKLLEAKDMVMVRVRADESKDWHNGTIGFAKVLLVIFQYVFIFVVLGVVAKVDHHNAFIKGSVTASASREMNDGAVPGTDVEEMEINRHRLVLAA